jgi:hypothetical protein
MKLPDLPEKEQEPIPNAGEFPKQKPKFGFYRVTLTNRPGETGKKTASMIGGQSAPRRAIWRRAQAVLPPKADLPMDGIPPEAASPTESRPARPVRISDAGLPPRPEDDNNPGRRLHAFEAAGKKAQRPKIPWKYRLPITRETTHRAYWDVTTTFSLVVNAILVGLLIVMALQIRSLQTTVNNLLGGLYSNFVKMDQADISTTIAVNTQIPLNFNLPVSQNTAVVLTNNVTIPKAHVVINTGGLNINAQASVTLPAGTSLPIALNLAIPVQSTIPISLLVPVSIPINQTGLHEPFTGLQTTLRPVYCTFDKNAQYPEGTFICAEHDVPTPGTP